MEYLAPATQYLEIPAHWDKSRRRHQNGRTSPRGAEVLNAHDGASYETFT